MKYKTEGLERVTAELILFNCLDTIKRDPTQIAILLPSDDPGQYSLVTKSNLIGHIFRLLDKSILEHINQELEVKQFYQEALKSPEPLLIKSIMYSLGEVYASGEYDEEAVALTFLALHVGSVADKRLYKEAAVETIKKFRNNKAISKKL